LLLIFHFSIETSELICQRFFFFLYRHRFEKNTHGSLPWCAKLGDINLVTAEEGQLDYIGRIVEFFETTKKKSYIAVKWFFRAVDTVIQVCSDQILDKRVFSTETGDDNPLDCIVNNITVVKSTAL
ncbi:hypothetical protein MKW98_014080, partial [Papaver atlanticum]